MAHSPVPALTEPVPDAQAASAIGRKSVGDILALATLPAVWHGAAPLRIAESLAAALFTTLGPEFVYVRLSAKELGEPVSVAQVGRYETSPVIADLVGREITRWVSDHNPDECLVLPRRDAPGMFHIWSRPIGHGARLGVVGISFPGEGARPPLCDVALNVVTTQAAIAIENTRLVRSVTEKAERLDAALTASHTGTFRWDIRTNALDWDDNLDALFGLPAGETVRNLAGFFDLIHPDDRSSVMAMCRRCAAEGSDFEMEFRVVWPDGTLRWLHDKGSTFRDENGRPAYMTGACVDITRLKEAQAERELLLEAERAARSEAERANRLKDEFLATISHELRTPLSAIIGWAHLLRMQGASRDPSHGLEVIERNARAQSQLIEDLLDMSRIVSGKMRLDIARVDLAGVTDAAIESLRPAAQAKGIALERSHARPPSFIDGDPMRLQQVVWNLVSNAIKFTPSGGVVKLELQSSSDELGVVVSDTGAGIAAEFLPHVFDRFRQADSATTRYFGGLGLGLAIVRSIVEMHGGHVAAYSDGPGRGAKFEVRLPASAMHDGKSFAPAASAAQTDEMTGKLDGKRVLVVDDEADVRELVERLLADCGAEVDLATNCAEALEAISSRVPDLLVSDIGMPGEDGYSLIRRVRSLHGSAARVPALALTAFARPEDRERALEAGFQLHLRKPFDASELIAALRELAAHEGGPSAPASA